MFASLVWLDLVALPPGERSAALLVRALAVVGLLLLAALAGRPRLAHLENDTITSVFASGMTVLLVWAQGGEQSLSMPYLPAMGLLLAVWLGSRTAAISSYGVLTAGVFWLVRSGSNAPLAYVEWLVPTIAFGVVAARAANELSKTQAYRLAQELEQARAQRRERALTEELDLQRAVASQTEHLALVGQLAAGVAHEINNPLAIVKANLEYLDGALAPAPEAPFDPPELRSIFQENAAALERIRLVVTQLKAFARRPSGVRTTTSAAQLIPPAVAIAQLRVKTPITQDLDAVAARAPLDIEVERVEHLVVGLLLNAGQALEETRDAVSPGVISVRVRTVDHFVELSVEDRGPGFAPETLAQLFTPFFTTKTEGAGMGLTLSLARHYLRGLGGDVTACNRKGGGARVTLLIPRRT